MDYSGRLVILHVAAYLASLAISVRMTEATAIGRSGSFPCLPAGAEMFVSISVMAHEKGPYEVLNVQH